MSKSQANKPSLEEYEKKNHELEVRYANLKRRYVDMKGNIDFIYKHPLRFCVANVYHRFIKGDRIV
jgi:hypothetical protein